MSEQITATQLREHMHVRYPDTEEVGQEEHPMTAVGVVLLAAGMHGITSPCELMTLTGYSQSFISAIIFNLRNNGLWDRNRYDASTWIAADGAINDAEFWDHIAAACGDLWFPSAVDSLAVDACRIYWADEDWRPRWSESKP